MPELVAEVVNWAVIRDTVAIAIIAGVGLSAAFGFVVVGLVVMADK